MTIYYLDPDATGEADGTTWADAWTTLAAAVAYASYAPGDSLYARGAETVADNVTLPLTFGGTSAGWLSFMGCDAAGTPGAGRYVLTQTGTARINMGGAIAYLRISGLHVNGGYHGLSMNNNIPEPLWIDNCIFENATYDGVSAYRCRHAWFDDCVFRNNGRSGVHQGYNYYGHRFRRCVFHGNTTGHNTSYQGNALYQNCIFYNNTDGVQLRLGAVAENCIIDGNSGIGANTTGLGCIVRNCRITNNGTGINVAADRAFEDYNVFDGNTTDISGNTSGGEHSIVGLGHGYTDYTPESDFSLQDWTLTANAPGRLFEVDFSPVTTLYTTAGLEATDPEAGTGGGDGSGGYPIIGSPILRGRI